METNEKGWAPKLNPTHVKVLVIEANEEHWFLLQRIIHPYLPQLDLVRMSKAAHVLALLDEWQHQEWELPKLILLDLHLPTSGDGWQVLEYIKQMPAPASLIPIVMLSVSNLQADIVKAYQLGASSYLVKPVDFRDWPAYIRGLCAYWWEISEFPPMHYVA